MCYVGYAGRGTASLWHWDSHTLVLGSLHALSYQYLLYSKPLNPKDTCCSNGIALPGNAVRTAQHTLPPCVKAVHSGHQGKEENGRLAPASTQPGSRFQGDTSISLLVALPKSRLAKAGTLGMLPDHSM